MIQVDISPKKAPILVATDSVADGELIASMLGDEFANMRLSLAAESAVSDFETHKPVVLILAFDSLDASMQYCFDLYQKSELAQARQYRMIALCTKYEVWRAFELCRNGKFDDYVLFWPVTNDAPRLTMAVLNALDRLKAALSNQISANQLAMKIRPLASLSPELTHYISQIEQHIDVAGMTVRQAEQALDSASGDLLEGVAGHEGESFSRAFSRIEVENIQKHFQSIARAVGMLTGIAGEARRGLDTYFATLKSAAEAAARVRPVVLMVEDDEFQQKLVARALSEMNIDLMFASCAADVMGLLWEQRPNVILMDIGLPDVDGIEMVRRIRAIANFSDTQIVMVTGQSERNVVVESLRAGAVDFLVKPLDRTKLLQKLNSFIPVPLL